MAQSSVEAPDYDPQNFARALRESQDRLTGIISSAMDAIITLDEDQRLVLFNRSAEKTFGYQATDVLGKPLEILLPVRFREIHRQHIRHFGETGETNRSMGRLGTLYGLRSNGEEFPIEASISQLVTTTGRLYTVILRDVTDRVEAEERLSDSDQQLRATFEQAAVGISHISMDGRWLKANQRMSEITGYSQEELLAMKFPEITHPDDLPREQELAEKLISGKTSNYSMEKRYLRKDGSLIWVNLSVSLVRDINGSPRFFIKVSEDITEQKMALDALQQKSEEMKAMTQQLWQTARLATMGELAASIAHELNNPLAILSLRLESLMSSFPESTPERRELEIIEQEADRMANLVANLLQFTRSNQRQVSSMDVCEEVDRTLELIHTYLLHRHIRTQRDFPTEIVWTQADRQQMRQLFLNLFTNAADAMPGGGTLAIRIERQDPTGGIHIQVSDTGIGIRPEVLNHIMEPFYTTKPDGKGTGLGLAICKRIVEEHRGSIQITSPGEGQGTTIHLTLPGIQSRDTAILED